MTALTVLSILILVLAGLALIAAIAWIISKMGPPVFGDDPGGRDPNLLGQFMMWGNGPNYIDFLRSKRRDRAKKRKHQKA